MPFSLTYLPTTCAACLVPCACILYNMPPTPPGRPPSRWIPLRDVYPLLDAISLPLELTVGSTVQATAPHTAPSPLHWCPLSSVHRRPRTSPLCRPAIPTPLKQKRMCTGPSPSRRLKWPPMEGLPMNIVGCDTMAADPFPARSGGA